MRLDSSNRSFFGLVAASLGAYLALGVAACVLLSLLAYRVAVDGAGVLREGDWPLGLTIAFLVLVGSGAVLGLWSLVRQAVSSLRLARRVRALTVPSSPEVDGAARRAGLPGRVRVIASEERFSFAYGAVTPRVALSEGLVRAVSERELEAVLAHERYHVRNLDPLKVLLARALPRALFWLPALRDLRASYVARRELAADRGAVEDCGRPPLAGALVKVVREPAWPELGVAAAIGGGGLLDIRVAQLERGQEPRTTAVSRRTALLTALALSVLVLGVVVAVAGSGGLSEAVRSAMPEMEAEPARLALMPLCAVPGLLAAAGMYGWLSWRARRPLDTTHS